MAEETTAVLTKLNDIEYFHLKSHCFFFRHVLDNTVRRTSSSQPSWHEFSFFEDQVGPDGADEIVEAGIAPFDQRITSFLFGFGIGISFFSDVIFFTDGVKDMMNEVVKELNV